MLHVQRGESWQDGRCRDDWDLLLLTNRHLYINNQREKVNVPEHDRGGSHVHTNNKRVSRRVGVPFKTHRVVSVYSPESPGGRMQTRRRRNASGRAETLPPTIHTCKFFLPENNKVMGLMTRPMTE